MGLSSKRPHSRNYSVNKKRTTSGDKVKNALKHYDKLQARIKVEWETKWLKNALDFVSAKLKKFSVTPNKK